MRTSARCAQCRACDRAGVTLPELLVAIGVVVLLLSILLPALGWVRRSAQVVACSSNLRQLGLAHQMYMRDNREDFVPAGLSHGSSQGDPRNSWLTKLPPYMDTHGGLRSPVDRSPYWSVDDGGSHDGMTLAQALAHLRANPRSSLPNSLISRWSSYGVNIMLTDLFGGYPMPNGETVKWTHMNAVRRPALIVHFLMMTEGTGMGDPAFARADHADTDGWVSAPNAAATLARAAKQSQMHAHGGRADSWAAVANYGFLDGHVEALSFSVVYEDRSRNRLLPIATPSN